MGVNLYPEGKLEVAKKVTEKIADCLEKDLGVERADQLTIGAVFGPKIGHGSFLHSVDDWARYVKGYLNVWDDSEREDFYMIFPGGSGPLIAAAKVTYPDLDRYRACVKKDRCNLCIHQLKCLTGIDPVGFEAKEKVL